jgi:hypothetical protein
VLYLASLPIFPAFQGLPPLRRPAQCFVVDVGVVLFPDGHGGVTEEVSHRHGGGAIRLPYRFVRSVPANAEHLVWILFRHPEALSPTRPTLLFLRFLRLFHKGDTWGGTYFDLQFF